MSKKIYDKNYLKGERAVHLFPLYSLQEHLTMCKLPMNSMDRLMFKMGVENAMNNEREAR